MATREKVTVLCDGPCGGDVIDPADVRVWRLQSAGLRTAQVDLCPACSEALEVLHSKGSPFSLGDTRAQPKNYRFTALRDAVAFPPATPTTGLIVHYRDEPKPTADPTATVPTNHYGLARSDRTPNPAYIYAEGTPS
jgi:hypothetical protein